MKLKLCLTKFPGSEMIEYKGQHGVFIPLTYNGTMSKPKVHGRKPDMYVDLFGLRNTVTTKHHLESFVVIPPADSRDLLLESRKLEVRRDNRVAWLFANKSKAETNPVSSTDFEKLLDL